MKRITIADIARESGYSKTAVSFAFNRPERLSREARKKIVEIAERLGYIPDPLARNLSRSSSDAVGLLLPHSVDRALANPHLCDIVRGVGKVCHREALNLTIIPPVEGRAADLAGEAAVDGLLAIGLDPDAGVLAAVTKRKLPFVSIDGDALSGIPSVGIDDCAAARACMDYLQEMGHTKVAILGLDAPAPSESYRYSGIHRKRIRGVQESGVESLFFSCEPSFEAGYAMADRIVHQLPVSACFAFGDTIAIGLIRRCLDLGLRVPGDLSVAGFDGVQEADHISPRLAGIRQPGLEKGEKAAELLLSIMAGKPADSAVLPFRLEKGGSVGRVW